MDSLNMAQISMPVPAVTGTSLVYHHYNTYTNHVIEQGKRSTLYT